MSGLKNITKIMNKLLNSKQFMIEVYSSASNIEEVNDLLGITLDYYIASRDDKVKSINEIKTLYNKLHIPGVIKNVKKNETVFQALSRNIIDEGFVTHSCNGLNEKAIRKYGLGDRRIFNEQLSEDLIFLEEKMGKSKFIANQTNKESEIYYSSPGPNSFHYAASFSPERLYLGPLKQDRNNSLPVRVGETKQDYFMRVAKNKVEKIEDKKERKAVMKAYERVISSLCSKEPLIVFIPIKHKLFELNASNAVDIGNPRKLSDWIENMSSPYCEFFATLQGGADPSNMGNLVSTGVKVPKSAISLIKCPDSFTMMQEMAKLKGMEKGDEFNFFTGELVKQNMKQNHKKQEISTMSSLPCKNNEIKIETSSLTSQSSNKNNINKKAR